MKGAVAAPRSGGGERIQNGGEGEVEDIGSSSGEAADSNLDTTLIDLPGGPSRAMVLVPKPVAAALLATGFLEVYDDNIRWNRTIPVSIQQEQLLELLPHGLQRRALQGRFGITPPESLDELLLQPSSASTLPSQ